MTLAPSKRSSPSSLRSWSRGSRVPAPLVSHSRQGHRRRRFANGKMLSCLSCQVTPRAYRPTGWIDVIAYFGGLGTSVTLREQRVSVGPARRVPTTAEHQVRQPDQPKARRQQRLDVRIVTCRHEQRELAQCVPDRVLNEASQRLG